MGLNKGQLALKGEPGVGENGFEGLGPRTNNGSTSDHLMRHIMRHGKTGAHVFIRINKLKRKDAAIKIKGGTLAPKKKVSAGRNRTLANEPGHGIGFIRIKVKLKAKRGEHTTGDIDDINTLGDKGGGLSNNRNDGIVSNETDTSADLAQHGHGVRPSAQRDCEACKRLFRNWTIVS